MAIFYFKYFFILLCKNLDLYQSQFSIHQFSGGEYITVDVALDDQMQVLHEPGIAFGVKVPAVAVGERIVAVSLYGLVYVAGVYVHAFWWCAIGQAHSAYAVFETYPLNI